MKKPLPALETIHTVVFDFDGVFTDNKVWVDQDGRESVRCDRADGLALDLVPAFQRQGKLQAEFLFYRRNRIPWCWHGLANCNWSVTMVSATS